ncbi:MAG TPA: enoyl-CoA hydratase [Paenalcaligenes sp.]|nr:enoyl-CoA hydratase [Paenalcaligenes sp.]
MSEQMIQVETHGRVGLIRIDRPKVMNALNDEVGRQLLAQCQAFDGDDEIAVIVLTGNERAFAAGVDIAAMKDWSYTDVYKADYMGGHWQALEFIRKPMIAAVGGYALGGGCELAMLCDMIIAADTAKFGQPEINLGIIPGYGGTQRLPRAIGKAKAMDMALTGRMITAAEAEQWGLVSRVVPADDLLNATLEVAQLIASKSSVATIMAKESINQAFESGLSTGLLFERRNFHALFATHDQKEGMAAFVEKRKADFKDE